MPGLILSVRAATKPCGGVTSPPCSSALLWVCMRCVARGLCRAFGWGVTTAWLCSWGITSLGCAVLSHGCVIRVGMRPALPLPGWEQRAELPHALQQPWRLSGLSSPKQKAHLWGLGASTQHGCDLPTSVCRKGVTGICHLDVSLWLVT